MDPVDGVASATDGIEAEVTFSKEAHDTGQLFVRVGAQHEEEYHPSTAGPPEGPPPSILVESTAQSI